MPEARRHLHSGCRRHARQDRKSTRLNSSHGYISYAVFFFKDPAPPKISPLPLHDALPIFLPALTASADNARSTPTSPFRLPSACATRSEEHTSELQSRLHLVCRLFF